MDVSSNWDRLKSAAHPVPTSTGVPPETCPAPRISVVMPMYKESLPVLSRTVDSILQQTFKELELVVVVDNPDYQEAVEFLRACSKRDSRVRVAVNEKNIGVWPSYTRGVKLARGDYIAIQDADDRSLPRRLEVLHSFLEAHPEVDVVGASLEYVDESTKKVLMTRRYPASVGKAIKRYCPIAHGTTLRRKGLHERYGFYDEAASVKHAADYDLWCRWHLQGVKFANLPEVLYSYFQHPANFKSQNVKRILKDTVFIKRRYADRLAFGFGDRLYLWAESIAAHLPAPVIVFLFYFYNRIRSRSARAD
jgi:glycosyltransferase involved in cell wall biosynthesis